MAQNIDLARAKAAILYKPPLNESNDDLKFNGDLEDDDTDAVKIIEDILRAQEKLSRLKSKSGQQKLQEEWSNPLGQDLVDSLNRLVILIKLKSVKFCPTKEISLKNSRLPPKATN